MFRKFLPVIAALLLVPVGAAAQEADPQAEIDQTRQRREELNAELDVLRASDVDLQRESERLEGVVRQHEEAAATAQANLAEVEASLGSLEADVREAQRLTERRKALLRERAIAAYVRPSTESFSSVLTAEDYDEAHRKTTLLAEVAEHDADVLRAKQDAEAMLLDAKTRFKTAVDEAARLRAEADAELASATAARDRHAEVQLALETRIGEFQREADLLSAHEGQLVSLIMAKATPSTTAEVAPSTTEAAPSTTTTAVVSPGPGQPATTAAPATTQPPRTTTTVGGSYGLTWPAAGPVTSPYGMRWGRMHQGIDIGAGMGAPILAAGTGTVIYAGWMDGYGNVVLVDHGNGMVTVYAHQSAIGVGNGARVSKGQVIGAVGSTGNSTGPHLHFETRVNGVALDPMAYL